MMYLFQLLPSLTMQKNDVYSITQLLGSFGRNSFILELQNHFYIPKKKHSTYFHFLFFQPVGVVIMEHCRVTDNCLVLSARSTGSGCKLFPLLQKSSPDHRAEPSSLLTLVSQGRLGQPEFDLRSFPEHGSTKILQCVEMDVEALNVTDVGCGQKVFFSSLNECQTVMSKGLSSFNGTHILEQFYNLACLCRNTASISYCVETQEL